VVQVVGCDWGIESSAREDQCGICHGDGTTCTTVKQNFDKQVGVGYVEATVIPAGARNIRVEEVAEANNYLAIRNDQGRYYLNGHWYIQWSGDYEAAGTVIHYRRDGNKESFNSPGPLREPLHVMVSYPWRRLYRVQWAFHRRLYVMNVKKLQFIHTVNGDGSKTAKIIKRQC